MFCEKCGKEIQDGQAVCLNCGAVLYDLNSRKPSKVKPTKTILFNEPPKRAALNMCLFIVIYRIVSYAVGQIFNGLNIDTNSTNYAIYVNLCSLLINCFFLGLGLLFSVGYKHWEEKIAFISIGVMSVQIIGNLFSLLGNFLPLPLFVTVILSSLLSAVLGIGLIRYYNKFSISEKTLYYEGKIGLREYNKYCSGLILIPYISAIISQISVLILNSDFTLYLNWSSLIAFVVALGVSLITSLAYKNKADRLVFIAVSMTLSIPTNMLNSVFDIILISFYISINFHIGINNAYVCANALSMLICAVIGVVIMKKYNNYLKKLYY